MDVENMTPDELRAMADEKESAEPTQPWVKNVVIDGLPLALDMRVARDMRTLYALRDAAKGEGGAAFAALDIFDRIVGEEQREAILEHCEVDGIANEDRFAAIFSQVFEVVGLKK